MPDIKAVEDIEPGIQYKKKKNTKKTGLHGVQEAICIWGVLRNTIFAVTHKARVQIESRKSEGGEGGVTDALLRRVTTLDESRTD